jgi:hypothetical protein
VYAAKIDTRITESIRVIWDFIGRVSEYTVASPRNATSTECGRSSRTSRRTGGLVRERYAAMNTTIDQPMPISRRFAPVMLARASEHALSLVSLAALHASPNCSNAFPPFHASTMSTAYSGRTAMNARTAIARPAEMSSCATSAAHDRMKAAPTIASPNSSASTAFARDALEKRSTIAGIVRVTAMSREVRDRPAGASPSR